MTLGELQYLITVNDKTDEGISKSEGKIKKSEKKLTAFGIARAQMITDFAKKAATSAVNAFKNTIKNAVSAYADYEQLVGGIDTLFKDSSKKVQQYAAEAYKTVGISANEYMENVTSFSASLLQSLSGDTDKAADIADMAMKDMADNANKMGTDMSAIQNAYQGFAKQNYTMLDNLKLGYGGTKSEMERLLADAEKLTKKKYNIQNLSDVYEAIHAIQEEMGITGTTALEAEKTISGSINMTKASWKNLLTAIGSGRDVKKATKQFTASLKTTIKNIIPVAKNAIKGIFEAIKEAMPEIKAAISDIFSGLKSKLPAGNILTIVGEKIEGLLGAFQLLFDLITDFPGTLKVLENSDSPLLNGIATIAKLAEKLLADINQGIEDTGSTFFGVFQGATTWIGDLMGQIADWLANPANQDKIISAIEHIIDMLIEALPRLVAAIVNMIKNGAPKLIESAASMVEAVWNGLPTEGKAVVAAIGAKTAKNLFTKGKNVYNAAKTGVQKTVSFFRNITGTAEAAASTPTTPSAVAVSHEPAAQSLDDIVSDLEAHSNLDWGEVTEAVTNGSDDAANAMGQAGENLAQTLSQTSDDIANITDDLVEGSRNLLQRTWDAAKTKAGEFLMKNQNWSFDLWNSTAMGEAFFNGNPLGIAIRDTLSNTVEALFNGEWDKVLNPAKEYIEEKKEQFNHDWIDPTNNAIFSGGWFFKKGMSISNWFMGAADTLEEGAETVKKEVIQAGFDMSLDIINGAASFKDTVVSAAASVASAFNGLFHGDKSSADLYTGVTSMVESALHTPFGNAKGNWNVPYDNYPALLHRGEMVLTKSQARQFRDGNGGGGISADTLAEAVTAAMSRVYVMMSGEKVGDLTTRRIKKNLNARSYSRMRALGGT